MTTAVLDRPHAPAGAFGRIWSVVKLNFANPWPAIVLPWIIQGVIFLANVAIWLIIDRSVGDAADRADASEGFGWSGASLYIFVYMMVVAVQSMNLTFPFAQGYGVTRRDYYLGASLTFVLLAAMWSVGLTILAVIEQATTCIDINYMHRY